MICVINGAKRYLSLISYLREGTSLILYIFHNSEGLGLGLALTLFPRAHRKTNILAHFRALLTQSSCNYAYEVTCFTLDLSGFQL